MLRGPLIVRRPRKGRHTAERLNHFRSLHFHDPARILRELRKFEHGMPADVDPLVARLRTNDLRRYREWRDAALFTYGIGLATSRDIGYATEEAEDYDFITAWLHEGEQSFCPVQLKELPPADIAPKASLEALLTTLARFTQSTTTVLVIRLNRAEWIDFDSINLPAVGFAQVWLLGAASADASRWLLVGDTQVECCTV